MILRIATLTARVRREPLPYLAREVALVSYLAGVGAPVMAPSDLVPAGPYLVDGWAMSAWQHVEHQPDRVPDVRAAFAALDELHAAMRGFPDELPWLNPAADDFDRALAFALETGLASDSEAADLTGRRDALVAELRILAPERQALHGDSFVRNAVRTIAGPVWLDFEDCCSGPPVWDLAILVRRDPDPVLVTEIERRYGRPALEAATALRIIQVEPWFRIHEARLELGW